MMRHRAMPYGPTGIAARERLWAGDLCAQSRLHPLLHTLAPHFMHRRCRCEYVTLDPTTGSPIRSIRTGQIFSAAGI